MAHLDRDKSYEKAAAKMPLKSIKEMAAKMSLNQKIQTIEKLSARLRNENSEFISRVADEVFDADIKQETGRSLLDVTESGENDEATVLSQAQERANAALQLQAAWQKKGVFYSQNNRVFNESAKSADCASFVIVCLMKANQKLFDENNAYTGKGGEQKDMSMQRVVYELEYGKIPESQTMTEADYKKPYRLNNPKLGDIMMWKGHVGIVAEIDEQKKRFRYAHMISEGAVLSGKKYNDYIYYGNEAAMVARIADYTGRKDFYGFWTPPVLAKIAE